MANIDDIIRKNKQYLTQAQIDALVAASKNYNMQNAGNRAGALATAREQYDTGYRGLQNMGLAGNQGAAPLSGEVPRLQQQIQTPFDDYNQRLKDVEHQRLGVLGENYAAQTRAAWAAEAERRRKEEAYQRAVAAAQSMLSNIKTSITPSYVGPTLTDAEKAARKAQADGLKRTQQVQQQTVNAAIKAQVDGMKRTARPQDIAAAAAFNIAHYTSQPAVEAANAAQERGIRQTEQLKGATDASNANKYFGTGAGVQTQQDINNQYDAAKRELEGLKLKRHYGGSVSDDELQAAEGKVAALTLNSSTATPEEKKRAAGIVGGRVASQVMSAMGFSNPMAENEYQAQTKSVPDIRRAVNAIDGMTKGMATYDQKRIDEFMDVLKRYGFASIEDAAEFIRQYDAERNRRIEYNAFHGAYTALYAHQGEKPAKPVNEDEKDYTYRIVNGLKANAPMGTMGDALMSIWRDDKKIVGEDTTKYMTDAQRDAYNAIYEEDGVKAANEYLKSILPLVEMQRAAEDQKWLEQLATEKGFPAWLLARGTNLIGGVPAMVEKLGVGTVNLINEGRTGGTNEIKRYSPNSAASRLSNWADIVQSQQAQNILAKHGDGFSGKALNFMYNTGTSMADSLIAMGIGGVLGQGASSALFFSSAGNQAYKDAIDRGGTQAQATGLAILSGAAETIFEEVSLEKLTKTLKFSGKPIVQAVKDALVQAGVEGSEELFTEIANVLSDWAVMKDKSEIRAAINDGELGRFLWDRLSSATLGGLASGLGFGIFGIGGTAVRSVIDSKSKKNLGRKVRNDGDVQQVRDTAILLGGEAMQQAEVMQKSETDASVGELAVTVVQEIQNLGKELNQDQQVAVERIIDGTQMTAEEASDVYELLGKDTVEKMNYDGTSAEAFQKSYNGRVQEKGVASKEERQANAAEYRTKKGKQEAAERVWKDPNLGYAVTDDGKRVKMPGDLTAVSYDDQQKSNFAARTTAKVGRTMYQIAGMEAREGMTDEQKIAALKKNMNKAQLAKAEFIETLADALGVDMVIHDDMGLANGYKDNDGSIHFSLSSQQSILRVASHELTHKIREVSEEHYNAIKNAIIKQVGEDKFNKNVEQKKREYKEAGVKLSDDLAIEETVTEYSEKMLQDTDFLEDFVDDNPEAAKTLKGELLKILNAVKRAFKRAENRNYGQSFSNDIDYTTETLQAMYNGLEAVMERAQNPEAKAERREAKQTEEKAAAEETAQNATDELFMTEESRKAEEVKKAVEESAQKKTYVPGYKAEEVEKVLSSVVFGDRSNYEGDDYENARGMIAQLIPDVVKLLEEDPSVDIDDLNDRTKTAIGEMLKNYFEDDGDITSLREAIPSVIGVDTTAKGDLKSQDQSLFQMSAKLSKALGKKVTLVGETDAKGRRNASYKSAEKLEELWERVRDQFGLSDEQDFSVDLPRLLEFIEGQADTRRKASDLFNVQEAIDETTVNLLDAVKEMLQEKTGKKYSLDTDEMRKNNQESRDTDYMRLAEKYKSGTATEAEIAELQRTVDYAARKAGYKTETYHGTKETFTKFNEYATNEAGYHVGTKKAAEQRVQYELNKNVMRLYTKLGNKIKMPDVFGLWNGIHDYACYVNGEESDMITPDTILNNRKATAKYANENVFTKNSAYQEMKNIIKDIWENRAMGQSVKPSQIAKAVEAQRDYILSLGIDSIEYKNQYEDVGAKSYMLMHANQVKLADPVTYDDKGNIIPLSERFNISNPDIRYSLDTDAIRDAFTIIDTEGIEDGLEALKGVTPGKGIWALKDISRFLDSVSGGDKNLRNTLHAIFEAPHSDATGRYARGVERMQQKVLDIASRAGVCDAKGKHFDSKKSAAIQNIGEGFSNTYTNLKYTVKDAEHVTVQAYDPDTKKLVVSEKDYTLDDLRHDYGQNVADYVWDQAYRQAEDAQATGGENGWREQMVNTRPYTLADLQQAFPDDWQKLERAANEFREMYDEYIRTQNSMLATIYPIESEYESVEKLAEGIEAKEQRRDKMRAETERRVAKLESRLEAKKTASENRVAELEKKLAAKEKEMAGKRRTDTKAFRDLQDQAYNIRADIENEKADIAEYEAGVNAKIGAIRDALNEYEANVKDEIRNMGEKKAEMQNAINRGEGDSLKRMHRLHYRSDYFHHFTELTSGVQNLKAIFTDNTDISPAIVGKSGNTRAKTKWAGYYQQRMGSDYTADAINGMLKYVQLAEYKLAFDPLTAYLRDVEKKVRAIDDNTNRDNLIRYIGEWTNAIMGKSHTIDRALVDSGLGMRSKLFKTLDWINSRVIQNTLLFNMRSSLLQISNITNAMGIVRNILDWANGLRCWALAAKGDETMAAIMAQSNFLASRYMDNMQLTDSVIKNAKKFGGWMLGALDEVSAKATWWAAYTQYNRNPKAKVIQNMNRTYTNAVDYADDVTRRTHAGRGVGELAPAMTSKVINLVAPFQVEVNNTWQLLKDNVKQRNYLGLLSTGVSVFLFNTLFEAIVGSTPLGFDFIRAIIDICFGIAGDDPDKDDDNYGVKEIAQRLAGELAGGLPFAGSAVKFVGKDYAKKIIGDNTDVTRYDNTQIGLGAIMNTVEVIGDIGKAIAEKRNPLTSTNFISDIDDLLNIIMPMGGKQLARTVEGIKTVAQGYGSKVNKEGEEQVQFVTGQNILDYLHAGLFGKWALTEASEYFGEKRMLPQVFGAYNGPKSSIGKMVDAKEYKAALQTGIDGKQYFTLKYDLEKYRTQVGKRAEMMEQSLTPEQKAQLDAVMVVDKKKESKTKGAAVYQMTDSGVWSIKADYTSMAWLEVAELGDKRYNQAKESGVKPETFLNICTAWKGMSGKDKKDQARTYLQSLHLPKKQYDYIWTTVFGYKPE